MEKKRINLQRIRKNKLKWRTFSFEPLNLTVDNIDIGALSFSLPFSRYQENIGKTLSFFGTELELNKKFSSHLFKVTVISFDEEKKRLFTTLHSCVFYPSLFTRPFFNLKKKNFILTIKEKIRVKLEFFFPNKLKQGSKKKLTQELENLLSSFFKTKEDCLKFFISGFLLKKTPNLKKIFFIKYWNLLTYKLI